MTSGAALETMKRHYRERNQAAKRWKAQGGKVVGYAYTNVPEELIIASGCLPVMLTGNPDVPTTDGDRYMEDYFCPFVRSVHDSFVAGRFDYLDLAVFPHGNDSIKRCYFYLQTEKRNYPELKIPPLTAFDSLHTRKHIANRYVRDQVAALKKRLESFSGEEITRGMLDDAIAVMNENRRLLKKVAELRRAEPPRLSGTDALQIIGSGFFMPKEEHNELLLRFLAGAGDLPALDGVRLCVSGTILDNTQLYELVESCGAVIVAEDVCTGDRYSDNLVDLSMDPLDALTDRYHTRFMEGRRYPSLDEVTAYLVRTVRDAKGQGVLFNYLRWDDSHGWNYPSQRDALRKDGVPSIVFEMQEYKLAGAEQLRTRTQAFVEMIKGGQ